jgi:MYXO-CTERM domain-containing protein
MSKGSLGLASLALVGFACILGIATPASAADFYVDPVNGSDAGDGSAQDPWMSLQEVWDSGQIETRGWNELPYNDSRQLVPKNQGAPVGAGDTIRLRDGYHGTLEISGAYNTVPITVAAEQGHTPRLASIQLRAVSNWTLDGLSISPSHAPTLEQITIVSIESHGYHGPSSQVTVHDCRIFSVEDTSQWSAQQWVDTASSGIRSSAQETVVSSNRLKNVRMGISMSADAAQVMDNEVVNFSGDGMRGLGNDSVFSHNLIKNCYNVDDNHDDAFQSWSRGDGGPGSGEVRGIVLRGNTFINYEDPNQPHRGPLQGVGGFDGMFNDWVIENNVIMVDHWHGITLLGSKNTRIVNNTVVDLNSERPGPPWIRVAPHKDGRVSEDIVIRNNLATALNIEEGQSRVAEDHNIVVDDLAAFFVDPAAGDLHLLATSQAVDTGSSELAPATDVDGISRPQGAAYDLGAYEYHEPGVEPADTGVSPDTGSGDTGTTVSDTGSDSGMPDVGTSDVGTSDVGTADMGTSSDTAGAPDTGQRDSKNSQSGGCNCGTVSTTPSAPWWVGGCLLLVAVGFRRKRSA